MMGRDMSVPRVKLTNRSMMRIRTAARELLEEQAPDKSIDAVVRRAFPKLHGRALEMMTYIVTKYLEVASTKKEEP